MRNDVSPNLASTIIFGGKLGWIADEWTDSDDRVRGGKSQSHLKIDGSLAVFTGHLDIDTLGGAGFASQRTSRDDRHWDLSQFEGIQITIDPSQTDDKMYTFILKDEILPPDPDTGRERSTVSWEYDFSVNNTSLNDAQPTPNTITILWKEFKPTYRGRAKDDAKPLIKTNIRRMSIMIRSFFGSQKGDFTLNLCSINGIAGGKELNTCGQKGTTDIDEQSSTTSYDKSADNNDDSRRPTLLAKFFCCGFKL